MPRLNWTLDYSNFHKETSSSRNLENFDGEVCEKFQTSMLASKTKRSTIIRPILKSTPRLEQVNTDSKILNIVLKNRTFHSSTANRTKSRQSSLIKGSS